MPTPVLFNKTYRDVVSGFVGKLTGLTEYWLSCERCILQAPGLTAEGKPHEGQYFDFQQVELTGEAPKGMKSEFPETWETKLGYTYRDGVSGFTGVAMSRTAYSNGEMVVCLQAPAKLDTGKAGPVAYFADAQLEAMDAKPVKLPGFKKPKPKEEKTGGPSSFDAPVR